MPAYRQRRSTAGAPNSSAAPTTPVTTTSQRSAGFHEGVRSSKAQAHPAVSSTAPAATARAQMRSRSFQS
jgi:hypothetical protein